MGPDNDEARPTARGTGDAGEKPTDENGETRVRHPYVTAVELLADSATRERAIADAMWSAGYAAGLDAGQEVGYDRAEARMAEAWRPVAESVRRLGRGLSRDELELRRWDGLREEFGRPRPGDYTGGPKSWNGDAA